MYNLETELSAFEAKVTHHMAKNGKAELHYASIGSGPLLVFLHGFPDHWLTWWRQMEALAPRFRCVAMDLRGYNLSAQPHELDAYAPETLAEDVKAVIGDCNQSQAIVIGHDWGGFVAWTFAMQYPDMLSRLAIVNMPHPWAIARELARNAKQVEASAYVRHFQSSDVQLDFDRLSLWIRDEAFKKRHLAAMTRSNPNGMLNYYRRCFPAPPYAEREDSPNSVRVPTFVVHGLEDSYALPAGLNDLWHWVDAPLTIQTWPGVGHFVQQEMPDRLSAALSHWLSDTSL